MRTSLIQRLFKPIRPVPPGTYHYQAPLDDPRNYRLHLRVEEDGNGVLIVNAATVLHLNQTATEYAYYFVQNLPPDKVGRLMSRRYAIDPAQAAADYQDFTERVLTLIEVPDLDPVTFLDFDRKTPYNRLSAPYRLDCALTYRLPEGTSPEVAPIQRVRRELSTDEWKQILKKAWEAGIPHVVFTGGEPTLRQDLPELIAWAENLGMVSGLISDGLRLTDAAYLNQLLLTGLDHLMLVLQPKREEAWQALNNALAADIFLAVHLTLTPENAEEAAQQVNRLGQMGVKALSLSATEAALQPLLGQVRDQAAYLGMSLVWDLPVPYSSQNPIQLELSAAEWPEGAGRAWLYVEPDGDVLPAQGVNQVLGNLLTDPWEKIWSKKP